MIVTTLRKKTQGILEIATSNYCIMLLEKIINFSIKLLIEKTTTKSTVYVVFIDTENAFGRVKKHFRIPEICSKR